jgi:hypothetical protein
MGNRARGRWLLLAPLALMGVLVFITLGGWIVMQLWNWLLPPLFGWHAITFWQALGVLALCRILFGGFGPRPMPWRGMQRRMWERWERMTPEERERFRQSMRERWGFGASTGSTQEL